MSLASRAPLVLLGAAFLTFFDRALIAPMMTTIADEFDVGVAAIAPALTAHVVLYGVVQILWAMLSSRIGQLRVLRVSLILAALGSLASALAVEPVSLTIARAVAGAAFGATVPATLVYFGDTIPLARRGVAMANLATALALGITAGTAAASLLAPLASWRWPFAGAAVLAVAVLGFVWRLPAPAKALGPLPVREGFRTLFTDRWAVLVLLLALVEGIVLVGTIAFLPVALEFEGADRALAGVVTSAFGVAVILTAQLVKIVFVRSRPWLPLLVGGTAAVAGYVLLGVHVALVTVLVASVVFGFAWATAHTQLQIWMSDALSAARPVGAALFGMSMFGGGAIGASIGAWLAAEERFSALFLVAAGIGLVFTVAAVVGRARYRTREQA
jgi:predicted MFS family arabinose efflux permease